MHVYLFKFVLQYILYLIDITIKLPIFIEYY